MKDLRLLASRLVAGVRVAGRGAQQRFGWCGGRGREGTGGRRESPTGEGVATGG